MTGTCIWVLFRHTTFIFNTILRKSIEGYENYFDYITVEKIISIQGIFESDITTNILFSRMQNKIYRSLVMIQYHTKCTSHLYPKIVREYGQEIPQSQTADNPMAPRGRAAQPSRDTRKTN